MPAYKDRRSLPMDTGMRTIKKLFHTLTANGYFGTAGNAEDNLFFLVIRQFKPRIIFCFKFFKAIPETTYQTFLGAFGSTSAPATVASPRLR